MARRANRLLVEPAIRQALHGVEIEGLKVRWTDRASGGRWELVDDREVVVSSSTLEGLEANFNARKREQKKKGFKRDRVIVFPSYGSEPWVGTVTSRPNKHDVWIVREDNASKKERITPNVSGYGGAQVFLYDESAHELLTNLKAARAELERRRVQAIKGLAERLTKFEPNDKDHPTYGP